MKIGLFLDKKIREYINNYNMIDKGNGVVLGLSGGPDSVCLFFVLLALKEEYDLTIRAIHVNHCIRGEEADRDQLFVRELCEKHNIQLEEHVIDIPALVAESGRSTEEEARLARYELFDKAAEALTQEMGRPVKIAVAHNADDNAETVLFHMARGTGLDGMCGIAPKRDNIIRPLIGVSKADILAFLQENEIEYCIDSTNEEVEYDRNRIRHNIMPELAQVNDRALEHISEMTERLNEVADYINLEARGLLQIAKEPEWHLRKRAIATAPRVIASQALKLYLSGYMPLQKDVSAIHVETILDLLNEDGERQVQLPYKKTLIISYEDLYVLEDNDKQSEPVFNYREFDYEQGMKYPTDAYTKWFDCDKISGNVVIRNRAEGDFLTIDSAGNHKSLQDYFVDEKVPRHLRDSVPLVCDDSHVMWVVGYRISEYYKISKNTTRVLEISYTEE
jgi:tRNA(Ile)-lysidine synthase